MPEQVDVYYDGWGEHWRWGTLVSSNAITGRPLIAFEYSDGYWFNLDFHQKNISWQNLFTPARVASVQ